MTKSSQHSSIKEKLDHHVIFCADARLASKGSEAELECVLFLLKVFRLETVGDYRLLVNYNVKDGRQGNSLEVDVVVINRLGIFLLEIKNWHGSIEASDHEWVHHISKGRDHVEKNVLQLIEHKARVFHSQLFKNGGAFSHLHQVSVIGVVVLVQGLQSFISRGNDNTRRIVDLSHQLTEILSTQEQLHRGTQSRSLSDTEIQLLCKSLHTRHQRRDDRIGKYRILENLGERGLCKTFKVLDTLVDRRYLRLKRYELPSLDRATMEICLHHYKHSIDAYVALGTHPNLLATVDCGDNAPNQQDIFFEITELPTGPGLDEVMRLKTRLLQKMSLTQQLIFLKAISLALQHAHNHKDDNGKSAPVFHRNICPETVFQMRDELGTVKLGDFDFAKFGTKTISVPGQTLIDKPYTAPELLADSSQASARSDIYALGVLWYFMASLPYAPKQFNRQEIDSLNLPGDLAALLKQMTADDPSERPEKIEEVLALLSTYKEA